MKYRLQDMIDIGQFQDLQDRLNQICPFPSSIIDNDGNILTATAWQDVCTQFHRLNRECERECIKSDQYILGHIEEADPAVSYRCPHGLVDNATPIIVDGMHVGNFFTGQFFLETPDLEFFRAQAQRYGFDENAYLEAVKKVPVWTRTQLDSYLSFIKGLIEVISETGLRNLRATEARQKAEESEKKFQAMFDMASIGIAQTDAHSGRWVRVNQKICDITGRSAEELLSLRVSDITHPEDRERDSEAFQCILRGEAPDYRIEKRYIRKDGTVVWVNVNMTVIRDDEGQPTLTMAAIEDITGRRQAEEALRESEELLRESQTIAGLGSYVLDLATRRWTGSETLDRVLGIDDRYERSVEGWEALVHPDDRSMMADYLRNNVVGLRQRFDKEYRILRPDDQTERWVHGLGMLEFDTDGRPTAMHGTIQDINDRKQAERRQSFLTEILSILNAHDGLTDAISHILAAIQRETGFDAVGIRLKDGDDYPYFVQYGFSDKFLLAENTLIARDSDDRACRDQNGNVRLECTCGLVISGQTDPASPFFTPEGSFWTNDSRPLVTLPSDDDPRLHPRNRCIHEGFLSIALVPIRAKNEIVGLLQLNDRKKDRLTISAINFFQEISASIGVALAQKRATETLRANEELLRESQTIAGLGSYVLDLSTQCWTGSDELDRLLGIDGSYERSMHGWAALFHPDDFAMMSDYFRNDVLGRGRNFDKEYRIIRHDNKVERWMHALGRLEFDAEGRPLKMRGTVQDITERKRVQETVEKSERDLLEAQRLAHIGNWSYDPATQQPQWSEEMFHIWGLDPQYGAPAYSEHVNLIHPEDYSRFDNAVREAVEHGTPYQLDLRICRPDGITRTVITTCKPQCDTSGKVVSLTGTNQDITERKLAEEDKARLETQLHQAQKMESVGRLAGGVAHDFNNMLAVILGHVELALTTVDPGQPLHDDLEEIRKAANRSAELTQQLLAFARRQTIAPKVLNLNETVGGILKMLQRLIGEDINLHWHPSANPWAVKMDPSQIDQILANLCVNARHAIADVGQITIETENKFLDTAYWATHGEVAPGEYVMLAVSDNGCGMDKETLANIFEPFFTTKGVGEGTGLGLATVYGAVRQNNGFINVYSEPGKGTTFAVYLPRHADETGLAGTQEAPVPPPRGDETILLAEDEPAVLTLAARLLRGLGYTVLAAHTPAAALGAAREHPGEIHLLITDVVMPEMNGRDLASLISSGRPRLKQLFMSGYTANVIAHHGVLDEGVNFIQKPFSAADLAKRVREALDG